MAEVLKRDVLEGKETGAAKRKLKRAATRPLRKGQEVG